MAAKAAKKSAAVAVAVPERKRTDPREAARFMLNDRVRCCLKVIEKFRERLADEPLHALARPISAFDAAARIKVARIAVGAVDRGISLAMISEEAVRRMTGKVRFPSHSTSPTPTVNLAEECEMAAWAELVDDLRWVAREEQTAWGDGELASWKAT